MLARAGLELYVVHSSATKMKLQKTPPQQDPSTSVGCTLAPEDLEDRQPTTAGIGDCRSKESMPTSVGVGSYAVIAYDKRWYVASVTDVQDGVFRVSYTTPCRGNWKCGRTDEGRSGGE